MSWRFAKIIVLGATLLGLAGTPAIGAELEFLVDSAAVAAIKKSLSLRYAQLKPDFQDGVVGFTHDGLIALRETTTLSKEHHAELEVLISEDNKDRSAMYREIARANGRPDWENRFKYVFAERWIRRAPMGWYYRESDGTWVKKAPPAS